MLREQTCFAGPPTTRHVVDLAVRVILADAVPVLAAVVGVALAIVVDNEVVLVETLAYKLLVAVLVDLVVEIHVVDAVVVEGLLARLLEGSQLGELGPVVDL